jgi:hypothetical protein
MAEFDVVRNILTDQRMNEQQLEINMDPVIDMLEERPTSLYSLAALKNRTMPIDSHRFEWLEDEWLPFMTAVNNVGGYTVSDTQIVVDDASIFKVNDTCVVAGFGGERMLVVEVNTSTNTITVIREYGETAAASISDNDEIIKIGAVNPLGGDILTPVMTKPADRYNYVQTFSNSVSTDHELERVRLKNNESERARQLMKVLEEHNFDIDLAMLFGQRKKDTTTFDTVAFSTGGIDSFVSTNRTDVGGALTKTAWTEWVTEEAFSYGSKEKTAMVGTTISEALSDWYEDDYQLDPYYKELGIEVMSFKTPRGQKLNIMHHELFDKVSELQGSAIAVDLNAVVVNVLSATKARLNLPTTARKYLDEYVSTLGFKLKFEKRHAILTGVTSFT